MAYIRIEHQDSVHHYDADYHPITTWNDKYCEWIINEEYEDDKIDWQTDENGITEFPRGVTMAYAKESQPNADNYPVIQVTWIWDEEGYVKQFGQMPEGNLTYSKTWEYLDYSEEKAIERLGKYCDFNKHAIRTVVKYNNDLIFDGKL